jgi:DNA-binding transcriptional MerR regulator
MEQVLYIHQVARAVGLTPQAIRYYERLGLIDKPERTDSRYRVYPPTSLERVRFIKQAQVLGFSLKEILEVLRLKYSGQSPCECVRGILKQKLARLKKQMVEMEKLRREIEACLRASRKFSRLPHQASFICPVIQSRVAKPTSRRKGGEKS